MIDLEGFEKQSKGLIKTFKDMQDGLTRNMQTMSLMDEAEPVVEKMKALQLFMTNGDMEGVLKIQNELIKMKQDLENDGDTAHTNK